MLLVHLAGWLYAQAHLSRSMRHDYMVAVAHMLKDILGLGVDSLGEICIVMSLVRNAKQLLDLMK